MSHVRSEKEKPKHLLIDMMTQLYFPIASKWFNHEPIYALYGAGSLSNGSTLWSREYESQRQAFKLHLQVASRSQFTVNGGGVKARATHIASLLSSQDKKSHDVCACLWFLHGCTN